MTILGIPFLIGESDLRACVESIDHPVGLVIINNSGERLPDYYDRHAWVVDLPHNIGAPAAYNLIVKIAPANPYWLIANHDTRFGPGDLARVITEMEKGGPRWVGVNGDWRLMGITAEAIERVGFWDENYHPIYCDDPDMERRCDLAGVPWYFIDGGSAHVGSASIRTARYGDCNARTYPANVAYFERKWGTSVRGAGGHDSPFDEGGPLGEWTLDLARLRNQRWETTALTPVGETR